MMFANIGVEVNFCAVNGDLAQKACGGELVKCVVDGSKRYRKSRRNSFIKKTFGRNMAVGAAKKQRGKG